MNEKTDKKITLTFPLTFTIEESAMQNFFDNLIDRIAERTAIYLAVMQEGANQKQPAAAAEPAADPLHDDPNEPWGDDPETEGDDE